MEIEILFADGNSAFEKSFLEQNYPYFKTLFNSGMKDSRSEKMTLEISKIIFSETRNFHFR